MYKEVTSGLKMAQREAYFKTIYIIIIANPTKEADAANLLRPLKANNPATLVAAKPIAPT